MATLHNLRSQGHSCAGPAHNRRNGRVNPIPYAAHMCRCVRGEIPAEDGGGESGWRATMSPIPIPGAQLAGPRQLLIDVGDH